jgi:hypothetical protein
LGQWGRLGVGSGGVGVAAVGWVLGWGGGGSVLREVGEFRGGGVGLVVWGGLMLMMGFGGASAGLGVLSWLG